MVSNKERRQQRKKEKGPNDESPGAGDRRVHQGEPAPSAPPASSGSRKNRGTLLGALQAGCSLTCHLALGHCSVGVDTVGLFVYFFPSTYLWNTVFCSLWLSLSYQCPLMISTYDVHMTASWRMTFIHFIQTLSIPHITKNQKNKDQPCWTTCCLKALL